MRMVDDCLSQDCDIVIGYRVRLISLHFVILTYLPVYVLLLPSLSSDFQLYFWFLTILHRVFTQDLE